MAVVLWHHGSLYDLSCHDCARYETVGGNVQKDRRTGLPRLRAQGTPLPCWQCPKTAGAAVRLRSWAEEPSARSRATLRHYRECRAVGRFPDDPIVRWCAGLIAEAEAGIEDTRAASRHEQALARALGAVLGG